MNLQLQNDPSQCDTEHNNMVGFAREPDFNRYD